MTMLYHAFANRWPTGHQRVLTRRIPLACTLLVFISCARVCAHANEGDDTLKFYLARSKLVVAGVFVSEPFGFSTEAGVTHWTAEFRIDEVIKGVRPLTEKFHVDIVRYDSTITEKPDLAADRPAEIKLGGKCFLFLDATGATADPWFGVQPPYPVMIRSLRRLAAEQSPAR